MKGQCAPAVLLSLARFGVDCNPEPCAFVHARAAGACAEVERGSQGVAAAAPPGACLPVPSAACPMRLLLPCVAYDAWALQGRSPNDTTADTEGSPSRASSDYGGVESGELGIFKLQLENMQLNLQSAHEEIKVVRVKCEKAQSELADARMQVAHASRECESLKQQVAHGNSVREADAELAREADAELESLRSEHSMYARMVFRLSKRCCTLLQRWSTFPSKYSARACFCRWRESVRKRRLVRIFLQAASLRRLCHAKRCTLNAWFRSAAAARALCKTDESTTKDEEPDCVGRDLRQALGVITNVMSVSPQALHSHAPSPAVLNSNSPTATSARLATTLSAALSALSTSTSSPPTHDPTYTRVQQPLPLDTLQRLKNAYRPANGSVKGSAEALSKDSFDAVSSRQGGKTKRSSDAGPLAWFLEVFLFEPIPIPLCFWSCMRTC